jgi:hypothetical protein
MSEPATPLLATGGLTVFGFATGLHPMLLVAGFVGCWWYNSYLPELNLGQRIASAILAAIVASWVTPPVMLYITSLAWWPATVPPMTAGFPAALAIGFLTHKVIGPALLRIATKKAQEVA